MTARVLSQYWSRGQQYPVRSSTIPDCIHQGFVKLTIILILIVVTMSILAHHKSKILVVDNLDHHASDLFYFTCGHALTCADCTRSRDCSTDFRLSNCFPRPRWRSLLDRYCVSYHSWYLLTDVDGMIAHNLCRISCRRAAEYLLYSSLAQLSCVMAVSFLWNWIFHYPHYLWRIRVNGM